MKYLVEHDFAVAIEFVVMVAGTQLTNVDRVDVVFRSDTDHMSGDAVQYKLFCCVVVEQRRR